jgi:hypothetical protein
MKKEERDRKEVKEREGNEAVASVVRCHHAACKLCKSVGKDSNRVEGMYKKVWYDTTSHIETVEKEEKERKK